MRGAGPAAGWPSARAPACIAFGRCSCASTRCPSVAGSSARWRVCSSRFDRELLFTEQLLYGEPTWVNYTAAARFAGAPSVPVPLREWNTRQIDLDNVRRLVAPWTCLLVVVSLNNPTGTLRPRETIRRVADSAIRHNLRVISDEIYEWIGHDNPAHLSLASCPRMREPAVPINGFSTAYSMTGRRLGYAPPPISRSTHRVHQDNVACASALAQAGGVVPLTGPQTCVTEMVAEFKRRRELVVSAIKGMRTLASLTPGGAGYVWANIQGMAISSDDSSRRLLERECVPLVPGPVFGASGQGDSVSPMRIHTHGATRRCGTSRRSAPDAGTAVAREGGSPGRDLLS